MNRCIRTISVSVVVLFCAGAALLLHRPPPPSAVLADGTRVELRLVTRGTNHVADSRTPAEKIFQALPRKFLPARWRTGSRVPTLSTPTNAIVLWVHFGPHPAARYVMITDTNGLGGRTSAPAPLHVVDDFASVVLTDWPRRAPQFALTFLTDWPELRPLGWIVVPNPARPSALPDEFHEAVLTATNGSLELHLAGLEILPGGRTFRSPAGPHWTCRARFTIREADRPTEDWIVQSLRMFDSAGNQRPATGPREWSRGVYQIFGDRLWGDERIWRLEADLTRVAKFAAAELVTFTNVPVPSASSPPDTLFHADLLGHAVTLHSMKHAEIVMKGGRMHGMGAPGFAIEVNDRDPEWVPRVVSIISQRGEILHVPKHGYGDGYSLMRYSLPDKSTADESCTVVATIQPRRHFQLFAAARMAAERPGLDAE